MKEYESMIVNQSLQIYRLQCELEDKDQTIEELTTGQKRKRGDCFEDIEDEVKEYLHGRKYPFDSPNEARKLMLHDAYKYYIKKGIEHPKTIQRELCWAMYSHPESSQAWKDYVLG